MEKGSNIIRVTAAILVKDRKVLLARRRAGGHQPNRWEFPGGKIEPGESPRQCLRRELSEEFSIETTVGEFLCSSLYRYDFGMIELMAFRVVWTGGWMALREHRAVRWASPETLSGYDFSPADIPIAEKIQSGEIRL
jgi:8-oxo-dGTP diphosphatase